MLGRLLPYYKIFIWRRVKNKNLKFDFIHNFNKFVTIENAFISSR